MTAFDRQWAASIDDETILDMREDAQLQGDELAFLACCEALSGDLDARARVARWAAEGAAAGGW